MNNGDYPLGAKYDKNAPYNQKEQEPLEIEVSVFCVMHRNIKIKVTDYLKETYKDEDGLVQTKYDFSDTNFYEAVADTRILNNHINPKDWCFDEIEVIPE